MPKRSKTILAFALSGAVMVASTGVGAAAMLDLPILGFGGPAPMVAAAKESLPDTTAADTGTTTTTTAVATTSEPAPIVVERIQYVDKYVTVGATPSATPTTAAKPPSTAASTATTATTKLPAPSPPATAPTTTAPMATTTTRAPSTTTTRPEPPAGCQEPEWDKDLQQWHCKGN
jgi:hypothetical protein